MRTPSFAVSSAALFLIWVSGTLPGTAGVYKENIDVPLQTTPARKGLFFRPEPGFDSPIPSERYGASRDGKAHLRRNAQRYPAGTAGIITYRVPEIMKRSNSRNTEVIIDIARQRAFLLVDGMIGLETPVSTARSGKITPTGTFVMTERVRSGKISTLYDVEMPFWMRLNDSEFGVHAGFLPGYPASAGCIRLPLEAAQSIFNETRPGTRVRICGNWRPPLLAQPSQSAAPSSTPARPEPAAPARPAQTQPAAMPVDALGQTYSRVRI